MSGRAGETRGASFSLPFATDAVLSEILRKWSQTGPLPAALLLRVSLLRELFHHLHSHKSRCLASGQRNEARELKNWEGRIEELRTAASLDGELPELLGANHPVKKRSAIIPQNLFTAIPKEKLERYDRGWENVLAGQACAAGWRFWTLDAWVQVAEVESWNRGLAAQLWPDGIVLFVEGLGFEEAAPPQPALWQGQWTLLLDPKFRNPAELSFEFQTWPGASGREVRWKPLFTPPVHLRRA